MKKYLLLIENVELWEKFKKSIEGDINSEIMKLIRSKTEGIRGRRGSNERQ